MIREFIWPKLHFVKNELTVDNKLLALLPAHSPAILSINKTINIEASRATNCKRLSCQESVQCCKHLVEVTQIAVLNGMDAVTSSKVVITFKPLVNFNISLAAETSIWAWNYICLCLQLVAPPRRLLHVLLTCPPFLLSQPATMRCADSSSLYLYEMFLTRVAAEQTWGSSSISVLTQEGINYNKYVYYR